MSAQPHKIPLRVSNKTAYIWDVDDIATVRSKHHICGILIGTLPHLSQQNIFLGVPLVLMPEEAVLLVENGSAVLVDDVHAHPQPHLKHLQSWSTVQQQDIKQQLAMLEAKGMKESTNAARAMSPEALKKRQAREEKRAEKARLAQATGNSYDMETTLHPQPQETTPESKAESIGHTVIIPASSSFSLDWYNPDSSCSYDTIAAAKAAGIWDFPSTLQERAKCGVFRGLWEQGYFLGGGIKFGGDYLVYAGDPLRYHSHFSATVIDSPLSSLRPMEVVAHGRLGTATKKTHLLCSWDDDKKVVSYLTIEWAGFG